MKSSTLKFTIFVSVMLLGFCAFLLPSALDLYRVQYEADVGPGLVPMICLVGIAGLTIYTLVLDIRKKRKAEAEKERETEEGELDKSFLGIAMLSILLMGGYAVIWAHTSFVIGSLIFCSAMGLLCMPQEKRTVKGALPVLFFLSLFVVGVWFVFVKLLGVNLG
ncbi:MAG: hypothetical protein DELT_00324 [Desulfovibrio sp.]